ncbi:MAG TPA: biopolymer transporter ExbD [Opitutales bacterium]|jgi:biopolymer transport protein ExbD|nr:biopolymer transporter ExbD [Opitutales bacterium]
MARTFKRKDRLNAMSEINITSLLDLVFCLLIIFMITATAIEQHIPIHLPVTEHDASAAADPKQKFVSVTIDEQGRLFYDKGATPVTAEELTAQLNALGQQPNPPTIDLREAATVQAQQLDPVLVMIHKAGLTKLSLDTQVK